MTRQALMLLTLSLLAENVIAAELIYPIRTVAASKHIRISYPDKYKKSAAKLQAIFPSEALKNGSDNADTLIILGGLDENPELKNLYAHFVTDADAVTPGSDGILVQSIHNWPEPGGKIIIVAGDVDKGVQALGERVSSNLPDIYNYTTPEAKNYQKSVLRRAAAGFKPDQSWKNFYDLAEAHRLTGDSKYRDAMVASLEALSPIEDNHYGMGLPILGYDYWARSGLIPPSLIHKADQVFLSYLIKESSSWWRRSELHAVFSDNRHHVYGTWGYLQTAKMLWRGLDKTQRQSEVGRYISERIAECDRWFAACRREYRPTVLSTGVFININIFLLNAIQDGNDQIPVSDDQLYELAKLCAAATDNTGGAIGLSGYEDTYPGAWQRNYPAGAVLNLVGYLTANPSIRQLRKALNGIDNQTWWMLSSDHHAWATGKTADQNMEAVKGFQTVLSEHGYPLYISYRNGFSANDLFFCLTGSGTTSIDTGDSGKGFQTYPGMLARLSWNSVPFFVQNTNLPTPLNRNMLTVDSRKGNNAVKADMKCEQIGKVDGLDYLTAFIADYCGVDWRRRILVQENEFMLIADTVTAKSDDFYSCVLTWRTPFALRQAEKHCEISFNGKNLQMISDATVPCENRISRAASAQGALRPDFLRQYFNATLKKGESVTAATLLYPGNPRYQLRMKDGNIFLLRHVDSGKIAMVGFGPFSARGVKLDGPVFYLPEDSAGYQPGFLRQFFVGLWESAKPASSEKVPIEGKVSTIWNFSRLENGKTELRNFKISSNFKDIEKVCNGNLDRYMSAGGKMPLTINVEFPEKTDLGEAIMLFSHDDGRQHWYRNPPDASPAVEVYVDRKRYETRNCSYMELDESYKGVVYSYTGTAVTINKSARTLELKVPVKQLYQLRLFGSAIPGRTEDAQTFASDKLLIRSNENEIICLNIGTGAVLWQTKLPWKVRSWAVGSKLLGVACADSTIKALDLKDGKLLWSCDTSGIPLGIPYSVAPYGDGFITSSYYHMTVISADGKILNPEQKIVPGMWIYNIMGNVDLNGDGIPDAIGRALWGHVCLFDGKTGKVDYFANMIGPLTDWRLLRGADGKPELLTVSSDGIGLYHASIRPELLHPGWDIAPDEDALLLEKRSNREIWSHCFQSEIRAFAVFNNEYWLGFETGIVRAFRHDGNADGTIYAGAPVLDLTVWKGVLLVNTGERIEAYNAEKRKIGSYELKNNGLRAFPEQDTLLAFTSGGVTAVKLSLP